MGCPPRLSVAAGGVAVNFITWYTLISRYTINGGARRCHSGMGGADTPTDKETENDQSDDIRCYQLVLREEDDIREVGRAIS